MNWGETMGELTFYKDYKHIDVLRKSFNELATNNLGLRFEELYDYGYWNHRYIPYSYVDGDKVVANVSVNLMNLIINGEHKKAIQLGTVTTHPDYRRRGLATNLINRIIAEYENDYDFIYAYANETVFDFYSKFGFEQVAENQFFMDYSPYNLKKSGVRKLDGSNKADLDFIYNYARQRIPVSNKIGTIKSEHLLMFYCIYVFNNDLYYIEDEDAIVIYKTEGETLNIFDVVSKKEVNMERILSKIAHIYTNKIIFYFTPQYSNLKLKKEIYTGDDILFVKACGKTKYPMKVKHPFTSKS